MLPSCQRGHIKTKSGFIKHPIINLSILLVNLRQGLYYSLRKSSEQSRNKTTKRNFISIYGHYNYMPCLYNMTKMKGMKLITDE